MLNSRMCKKFILNSLHFLFSIFGITPEYPTHLTVLGLGLGLGVGFGLGLGLG